MKIHLRHILAVLGVVVAVGLAVFWFGLINIGASTGHWAITNWILHTAMQRSVQFRADAEPPEDYGSDAMVRRGAGHYETGCAPCHGSPSQPRGAVVREMTPEPPALDERIAEWSRSELFQIVKHGVKFTGMPAWPALSRDDEVWSVVAFLERMPRLTAARYRRLAYGEAAEAAFTRDLSVASVPPLSDCIRCHGRDGAGDPDGAFPRLDIQDTAYLLDALEAYANGHRFSGIMQSAVMGLQARELERLAGYYGMQDAEVRAPSPEADPDLLARGQSIAQNGIPADNVGACAGCHEQQNARPGFPRLAGQYREYLETQLELFAAEDGRGGSSFASLMEEASHALEDADIEAVAAWYASQVQE